MEFEEIAGGAKGYYSQTEKRIAIQERMSEVQTVKTAIYEMAHQKLHAIELGNKDLNRNSKEVEAESVAYTVCQHYGIDTSDYSLRVIKRLSQELTERYGKGYDRSNLYHCLRFYKRFPEIVDAASRQFENLLSWTHYRTLLQVEDGTARAWYAKEAAEQTWSVKTLQRNISSQYYYRMLKTQGQDLVENEMKELTAEYQQDKLEFSKNPVVVEFLGLASNTDFTESDLEKSILFNLQKFLMELGKGYAFVARQQHIHTEKQDYYIDLVFYNYILKCFVLIDLKTEKLSHADVGYPNFFKIQTYYNTVA